MSRLRLPHAVFPVVGLAALLAGCGSSDPPSTATPAPAVPAAPAAPKSVRLRDCTDATGIELVTVSGETPTREILEVNGTGLALLDYDDDGDLDLFAANGATLQSPAAGPGWRLYRNDGGMRFADVSAEALPPSATRWGMGVAVGDADGDGRDDLYVACYGPNVLLRNTGIGTFEDVSAAAGVDDDRWGTSCAFGDLDGDGDLDLYVVNYLEFDPRNPPPRARHKGVEVMNGPHGLVPQADVVYENLGSMRFGDMTEATEDDAPVRLPMRAAYGLNVAILDFDNDGRQDVFVGNDSMANFLFRGVETDGVRGFEEIGLMSGVAANLDGASQATMGIAVGDVSGNFLADLFTTNFANDSNTLHVSQDGQWFDDLTGKFGLGLVSRPYLGWACSFADLDHDGDEDLLIFNGHVYPEATAESMDSPYEQRPLLFVRGASRFRVATAEEAGPWLDEPHRDRAAVLGDLDRDGDLDAVVAELNGPLRVLCNEAADDRDDWLVVALDDPGSANRRGLGSTVRVLAGEITQSRWIHGGGPFQSSGAQEAHFGVPGGGEVTVFVVWPDGTGQRVGGVATGQRVVIERE